MTASDYQCLTTRDAGRFAMGGEKRPAPPRLQQFELGRPRAARTELVCCMNAPAIVTPVWRHRARPHHPRVDESAAGEHPHRAQHAPGCSEDLHRCGIRTQVDAASTGDNHGSFSPRQCPPLAHRVPIAVSLPLERRRGVASGSATATLPGPRPILDIRADPSDYRDALPIILGWAPESSPGRPTRRDAEDDEV
jgi:hypothetical protein